MVFELELFRTETLFFLIIEISEEFMRSEFSLVEFSHDDRMFLHFSEESVDSFVVIIEELGLD